MEGGQGRVDLSVTRPVAGLVIMIAGVISLSALLFSLRDDYANSCVANVVPVTIDIDAKELVYLNKRYEDTVPSCKHSRLEFQKLRNKRYSVSSF